MLHFIFIFFLFVFSSTEKSFLLHAEIKFEAMFLKLLLKTCNTCSLARFIHSPNVRGQSVFIYFLTCRQKLRPCIQRPHCGLYTNHTATGYFQRRKLQHSFHPLHFLVFLLRFTLMIKLLSTIFNC